MWAALGVILPFIGRILPRIAGAAVRHPIPTLIGADLATGGASTVAIVDKVSGLVVNRVESSGSGFISRTFNSFAQALGKNGVFAAIPLFAALGAASGEGVLGRIFSGATMGAVAYIGARIADANGIRMPGLSLDFAAASSPAAAGSGPGRPQPRPAISGAAFTVG